MHRLRSRHIVIRFKLASWTLVLKCLLVPAALILLGYALIEEDHKLACLALGMAVSTVPLAIWQWMLSLQARCPLCLVPPVAHRDCTKHSSARPLFGSYRLRVANSVIFKNHFRCPYCGEFTTMETRADRPRSARHGGKPHLKEASAAVIVTDSRRRSMK